MNWLTALNSVARLLNRLFDTLESYDKERKQIRREDRRHAINENPDQAWRDTFGGPSGRLRVSDIPSDDVRHNSAAASMDGNQRPKSDHLD